MSRFFMLRIKICICGWLPHYFVAVQSAQILYRISSSSKSSNVSRMEGEALKVIKRAFERAPESLQYLKKEHYSPL